MCDKSNTYADISYYPNTEFDSNGYISFTTSAHRIAKNLNSINATLQQLDQDLVEYRKSVKSGIYQNDLEEHLEERISLIKKIQAELRVYHFYKQFTLQIVCQNFCEESEDNE